MKRIEKILLLIILSLTSIGALAQTKNLDANGLSDNLVGYFSFDTDVSAEYGTGNGKSGVLYGDAKISTTDTKYSSGALDIDATLSANDAYVSFDNTNSAPFRLNEASQLTVACWVKVRTSPNTKQYIISTVTESGGTDNHTLQINNSNKFYSSVETRDLELGFEKVEVNSGETNFDTNLSLNEWIHVAYVYNRDAQNIKLFINGSLTSQTDFTKGYNLPNFNRFLTLGAFVKIEADLPVVSDQFDGLIDELYFFDRALSDSEINVLQNVEQPLADAPTYTVTFDQDYNALSEEVVAITGNGYKVSLPSYEREGYTFEGWYTQQNGLGDKLSTSEVTVSNDITYYANWEAEEYELTLNKSTGQEIQIFTVENLPLLIPSDTKENETFTGWFKDSNHQDLLIDNEIKVIGNQEIWADFSSNSTFYKVTFSDRGNVYTKRIAKAENNYLVDLPALSARDDNYRLSGWYTEENGKGTRITFETPIASDITLYAYWTSMGAEEGVNIDIAGLSNNLIGYFSFDAEEENDILVKEGSSKGKIGDFSDAGASINTTDAIYSTGALEVTNGYASLDLENSAEFRMQGASAITIATWVKPTQIGEQYIIASTDENGGDAYRIEITSDGKFKAYIATYNEELTSYSNGNVSSENHKLGDNLNLNEWIHVACVYQKSVGTASTSIYINGNLSNTTYTDAFDLVTFDSRKIKFGAYVSENKDPIIQKQFVGLIDEAYFFDRALSDEEVNTLKEANNPTQPLREQIAIFDHRNNQTIDTLGATIIEDFEVDLTQLSTPTRLGYNFEGWYTKANGEGDRLSDAVSVLTLNEDAIYYANWETQSYTITLNKSGTVNTQDFVITDLPIVLEDDTKENETFIGWFKDSNLTDFLLESQITEIGNVEVWANFSANSTSYKVTLSDRNNVFGKTVAIAENDYKVKLLVPSREDNHRFAGWFTEEEGKGSRVTEFTQINSDITLYAHWTEMISEEAIVLDLDGLSDNLIGYFSFDESTKGDIVTDLGVAKNNIGAFVGNETALVEDAKYSGSALAIDPSSAASYVSFDASNSTPFVMPAASEITMALWVKPEEIVDEEKHILSLVDENGGVSYKLIQRNDNRFNTFLQLDGGNAFATSDNHKIGDELNLNEWVHVAIVFDSEAGLTSVYINGVLSGSNQKEGFVLKSEVRTLNIGANVRLNSDPVVINQFDGLIDELYFFDRALSINEIQTIRDLQNPGEPLRELIAVFDQGYGSEESDTLKVTTLENYTVSTSTIETPSRLGYNFDGWYTELNGQGEKLMEETLSLTEDITYYANWIIQPYTITLNTATGTQTQNFVITDLPVTLSDDLKEGENFLGWFTDSQQENLLQDSKITTIGNVELWADFSANSSIYEVTLSDRGNVYGKRIARAEKDYRVQLPSLEAREDDYRLVGWFTEENGNGQRLTVYSTITNDITLYAHWSPMTSDEGTKLDENGLSANLVGYFSFDANENTDVIVDRGVAKGNFGSFSNAGAKLTTEETKYSESALEIDNAYVGFDLPNSNALRMGGSNAISVAVWVKAEQLTDQYIVAATDENGGDTHRLEISSNQFKANIATYSEENSSYSNASAQSNAHRLGNEILTSEWVHVAYVYNAAINKTVIYINGEFSGEYEVESYNLVTFDSRKLNIGAYVAINKDEPIQKQFNGLIDELYFFDRALSQDEVKVLRDMESPNQPLKEYIAVFDYDNGVDADTLGSTVLDNYEVDVTSLQDPVREGYNFAGWYTQRNGEGEQLVASSLTLSEDVTFYAKWDIQTYTITLNQVSGQTSQSFVITDLPIQMEDDSKEGEYFLGWFTDMNCDAQLTNGTITSIGNIELWSDFSKNTSFYEVTLSDRGSVYGTRISKEENDYKVVLPHLSTRENAYRFAGWYTASEGNGEAVNINTVFTESTTLYAHWTEMLSEEAQELDLEGLSENLVGYFSFNSNEAGNVVVDQGVAKGNIGTFSNEGAQLVSENAKYTNSALSLNNAYVSFDAENSTAFRMAGASEITVACWVQPQQLGAQYLIAATDENGGDTHRFEITDNNQFRANVSTYSEENTTYSNANAQSNAHRLGNEVNTNEWIHIAYVYNSEINKTIIYVNGEFSGEYEVESYELVTFDTRLLNIGAQVALNREVDPIQNQFNGLLDELYFFDRALSLEEVKTLRDLATPEAPILEYIAVFDHNDGVNSDTLRTTVIEDNTIDPSNLENPTRIGYDFAGWFSDRNGNGEELVETMLQNMTTDAVFYANWIPKQYTITFQLEDGVSNDANVTTFTIEDLPFTLNEASKTDHYFVRWYEDEARTDVLGNNEITSIGDIQLWAKFSTNPIYTITYHLEEGENSVENETVFIVEELPITLEAPTKEASYFEGWYTEESKVNRLQGHQITKAGDIELWANYEVEPVHLITFNNVNTVTEQTFVASDLPLVLGNDTKENEFFLGWFIDESREYLLPNNTLTVAEDITLWSDFSTSNTMYTVTLNDRGTLYGGRKATTETDFKVNLPLLPEREDNFRFVGWFTLENGQGREFTSMTTIDEDITLYAHWTSMLSEKDKVVDIAGLSDNLVGYFSFDSNPAGNVVVEEGTAKGAVGTFMGEGVMLTSESKYSNSALEINDAYVSFDLENSELLRMQGASSMSVACWIQPQKEGDQYILAALDDNGSDTYRLEIKDERIKSFIATYDSVESQYSNGNAQSLAHRLGEQIVLNEWVHVAFVYNSAESKTVIYINGEFSGEYVNTGYDLVAFDNRKLNIGALVSMVDDQVVVENQYQGLIDELYMFDRALTTEEVATLKGLESPVDPVKEYIAVFNYNDGTTVDTLRTSIVSDYKINLAEYNAPTRLGYEFVGWYPESDGSGEKLTSDELTLDKDVKFYAQWEIINYTITFNLDEGVVNSNTITTFNVNDLPITLSSPTKTDEYFEGWYTNEEATDESKLALNKITTVGNISLWAQFTTDPVYLISYYSDGSEFATDYVSNGDVFELPSITKEGYTFGGWYLDDETYTNAFTTETTLSEDISVYAKWDINQYTISFEENGGSTVEDITLNFNAEITEPQDPTYTEAIFEGWYADSLFNVAFEFPKTMPATDTTVYAKWEFPTYYTISFVENGGSQVEDIRTLEGETISKPANPTKDGYDFVGWYSDAELTASYEFPETMPASYVTLFAKWEEKVNAVITFVVNGGSSVESISAKIGEQITPPNDPTYEGFIFEGWYTDADFTEVYEFPETMPSTDVTVYAKWTAESVYTISFEENGGSEVADIILTEGAAVTMPADPTYEGYTFAGWYSDADLTEVFEFPSTMPASDIQVYAKWGKIEYTITYNLEENVINDNISSFTADMLPVTLNAPIKEGEYFNGWYIDATKENQLAFNQIKAIGDLELWADFSKTAVYTITYHNGDETYAVDYVSEGSSHDIPTITEEGYTFEGWFIDDITFEQQFTSDSEVSSNINVYAKWSINQYTITFDENGGSEVQDIVLNYNAEVERPQDPTLDYHTFGGWYTGADFTEAFEFPETMPASDTVIYAKWNVNQYTISFEENGGTEVEDITLDYNSPLSVPSTPTLANYTFKGWYLDTDFTEVFEFPETMPSSDITLYAKWEENPMYTISFEENGGTDITDITQYAETIVELNEVPMLANHTFNGWFTDEAFTEVFEFPSTMPSSNITLYAKWNENPMYTISFEENGGTEITDITQYAESVVELSEVTILENYTFAGWYIDTELTEVFEFPTTMPSSDIMLYAKWVENPKYSITFEENGGSEVMDITLYEGDSIVIPSAPVFEGYQFGGWYTDLEMNTLFIFPETMPTENTVVYAKWITVQDWVTGIDVKTFSPTCSGRNDGMIVVKAGDHPIDVTLVNWKISLGAGEEGVMEGLASDIYTLTISEPESSRSISYEVDIPAIESIQSTSEVSGNRVSIAIQGGTAPYTVYIGSEVYTDVTDALEISNMEAGVYDALIKDSSSCVTSSVHFTVGELFVYPNPTTSGTLNAVLPFESLEATVDVVIIGLSGNVMMKEKISVIATKKLVIDVNELPSGNYFLNVICTENDYNEMLQFIVK